MKFGYVRNANGVVKSINLDQIRLVEIDTDSIIIRYGGDGVSSTNNLQGASYLISIGNPENKSSGAINENFYAWLKNSLAALKPKRVLLNDYMAGFEIIDAGISSTANTSTMTFQSAADSTAACAMTGGTAGIIDSKIAPAVGNLVLEGSSAQSNDLRPIDDGSYSLIVSGIKYFVTLVSSRISTVEVCPLLLDFVYDPNQQADGVADLPNYFTFAQSYYQFWNYYSGRTDISQNGGQYSMNCTNMNNYLRVVNNGANTGDKTWPCGYIFNGLLDASKGLGTLPAFGIVLNDTTVANMNGAQIYVSTDYYVTGDKNLATWVSYNTDFYGSGFAGLGNGTQYPAGGTSPTAQQVVLYNMSAYGRVFFPAGNSLVTPATSIDAGFAQIDSSGVLSNQTQCP